MRFARPAEPRTSSPAPLLLRPCRCDCCCSSGGGIAAAGRGWDGRGDEGAMGADFVRRIFLFGGPATRLARLVVKGRPSLLGASDDDGGRQGGVAFSLSSFLRAIRLEERRSASVFVIDAVVVVVKASCCRGRCRRWQKL